MTAPHYGKRNPGLLTAVSPGDTLYFNFASYNDSGDSEALSGFAVSDIEVSKNGSATVRATDSGYSLISDTGQFGDRVGLYRFSVQLFNTADDASFYAVGGWYQVAVDAVSIDGKTVRFWVGSFEIGEPRANIVQIAGDTGAANWLKSTFAAGFADTGINQRFAQIQSDVDTGLRVHIDDSDTGVKDAIADLDTGIRALLALRDTGAIATAVWAGDTGLRDHITNVDTGLTNRLSIIGFDVDTGLRAQISDVDTGLHDTLADYDTGVRALLALQDTGAVANAVWNATTRGITNVGDTGIVNSLAIIRADTDTGIQSSVNVTGIADTGINSRFAAIQAKTDRLTFDTGNEILADIRKVNQITVQGAGDTGTDNTWRPGT
jgi:hypothetical protein